MPLETTVTELSDSRVRLDAVVPQDVIESRLQRTATELGRELKLPGFRKGKVPPQMVLQRMGREAVLEQAVRDSLPEWYEEAVMRSGVSTVGDPEINLQQMPESGQPLNFSIEIGVTPKAKLGKYKGLEVGKREADVPEDAIDHEIGHLRDALARVESVDRAAETGDFVVMDFVGKVDDVPFEGGEARDYMLELGSGRLVDGFEEQLTGAKTGDSRSVEVTFPADYRAEDLAGKDAVFEVEVKDVKQRDLPELDDDFAAEASEFDTLDELRADIETKLAAAQENSIEDEFRQAAVDAVAVDAKIDISDDLVAGRAEEMWSRTERQLARQGMDAEAYLQAMGRTREQMIEEAKPEAARNLARESVLEAVAEAESIEITEEELLEVLAEAAEADKTTPDKVLARLRESGRDVAIKRDLSMRKAVDVLVESAKPIALEKAKVRDEMWTPEKGEAEEAKEQESDASKLWTPGS